MVLPEKWRKQAWPHPDFVTDDGREVIEVRQGAQGIRDLRAGLLGLAGYLANNQGVTQAVLAIQLPRTSITRAQEAWRDAHASLRPEIFNRLAIAVLAQGQTWVDPSTPELAQLAEDIFSPNASGSRVVENAGPATGPPFFYEIAKVLLEMWLRHQRPLQIQEIMRHVGCSHPTVAAALETLHQRGEIVRSRDRRVELRGLPRQTLEEFVVRSDELRQTQWVVDISGRKADPDAVLRRLQRAKWNRTALGGVAAARHYHPALDLLGVPRIDLTVWTPRGEALDPTEWGNLDPGLSPRLARQADAIVAVHRLARADALFDLSPNQLPYAGRVETLLDLYELRLEGQAQAFVKHLRGGAP